jgi:hypothetical protein
MTDILAIHSEYKKRIPPIRDSYSYPPKTERCLQFQTVCNVMYKILQFGREALYDLKLH